MSKPIKPVELFLTLGLTVALGACGGSAPNQESKETTKSETSTEASKHSSHSSEDGEAGEDGESASTGDRDIDYMTALALMKGHLIVAQELINIKEYEQAEPHIGHPVEELYGDVEGELSDRNVPDFKGTLNDLHDFIKSAPEKPEMKEQYDEAMKAIDKAIEAVPDSKKDSSKFILDVIGHMLDTADEEYTAAIADNKFVELVEYQDSRGFVIYAEELYETVADSVKADDGEKHATIVESFTELKKAWPSVETPDAPIKTPEEVSELVAKIKG